MITATPPARLRILLVDDQDLFRDAIRVVLELDERFEIVGEAGTGMDAIRLAQELEPAVILMDLRMPGISGSEATRRIHAAQPKIRILVLTTFDEDDAVLESLRNGATGYVLKNLPAAELKSALLATAQGKAYIQACVAGHVISEYRRLAQTQQQADLQADKMAGLLSQRERDILYHLVQGQSNKEIASSLGVTEGTVKNHLTNVFSKFKVQDRTALALKARSMGLI
jgi:DNA-binding NarL/FixJ family response regulator